jgi:hypothetical protein
MDQWQEKDALVRTMEIKYGVTLLCMKSLHEGQSATEANILASDPLILVKPLGTIFENRAVELMGFARANKAERVPSPTSHTLFDQGWIGMAADGAAFDLLRGKARDAFAGMLGLLLFCRSLDGKEGFPHWLEGKCEHEKFFHVAELGEHWEVILAQSDSVLGIHIDGGTSRRIVCAMIKAWCKDADEVMATAGIEYRLQIPFVDEEAATATATMSKSVIVDIDIEVRPPAMVCSRLCDHCERMAELRTCSRCRKVMFCSRECQLASWRAGHKLTCSNLVDLTALIEQVAAGPSPLFTGPALRIAVGMLLSNNSDLSEYSSLSLVCKGFAALIRSAHPHENLLFRYNDGFSRLDFGKHIVPLSWSVDNLLSYFHDRDICISVRSQHPPPAYPFGFFDINQGRPCACCSRSVLSFVRHIAGTRTLKFEYVRKIVPERVQWHSTLGDAGLQDGDIVRVADRDNSWRPLDDHPFCRFPCPYADALFVIFLCLRRSQDIDTGPRSSSWICGQAVKIFIGHQFYVARVENHDYEFAYGSDLDDANIVQEKMSTRFLDFVVAEWFLQHSIDTDAFTANHAKEFGG